MYRENGARNWQAAAVASYLQNAPSSCPSEHATLHSTRGNGGHGKDATACRGLGFRSRSDIRLGRNSEARNGCPGFSTANKLEVD